LRPIDHGGQLTPVFVSHRPLDGPDNGRGGRAVMLELLGAIGDLDARTAADVFVIRPLVRVLKPPPTAYIIDQDQAEISPSRIHIAEHFLKTRTPELRLKFQMQH